MKAYEVKMNDFSGSLIKVLVYADDKESAKNEAESQYTSWIALDAREYFRVKGECLYEMNNEIAKRPLSFWMEYFNVKPKNNINTWCWIADTQSGFINIEKAGGYGLLHSEYIEHKEDLYYVGNADLNRPKLAKVFW